MRGRVLSVGFGRWLVVLGKGFLGRFCAEGCGAVRWRIPRAIAVLAIGWFMAFSPASALAEPAPVAATALVSAPGHAQAPEPAPPIPDGGGQIDSQRYIIGLTGAGLIGLVALSRKMRKKPLIGVPWKKKG